MECNLGDSNCISVKQYITMRVMSAFIFVSYIIVA